MHLLFSLPRSGSRMLCSMLDSHPEISCPHEFFEVTARRLRHRQAMRRLGVTVGHAHYSMLHPELVASPLPKIVLIREDYTRAAVSLMTLGTTRAHGLYRLEPEYVRELADERRRQTEAMVRYADLVVSYEELTGGENTTELAADMSHRLCDFLGVERRILMTANTRNAPMLPENLADCYGTQLSQRH